MYLVLLADREDGLTTKTIGTLVSLDNGYVRIMNTFASAETGDIRMGPEESTDQIAGFGMDIFSIVDVFIGKSKNKAKRRGKSKFCFFV